MGISAIILSHNSEKTLPQTIQSVAFCDEVIVIDDTSTDNTVAIAKNMNAIVIGHPVNDDFSAQRNFGLTKAANEWVLFVDSDEIVSADLAREIQEAVRLHVNGFYLRRLDVLWGRKIMHGETDRVRLLRLAKKGKGKWMRPVHEVWNISGVVGTLQHPLHHFPHPNVAQFLSNINTYSTINARHLYSSRVSVNGGHIVLYPVAKFIRNYIFRKGFLDGMPGMLVSVMMSFHSFLTRSKLWLLLHKQ